MIRFAVSGCHSESSLKRKTEGLVGAGGGRRQGVGDGAGLAPAGLRVAETRWGLEGEAEKEGVWPALRLLADVMPLTQTGRMEEGAGWGGRRAYFGVRWAGLGQRMSTEGTRAFTPEKKRANSLKGQLPKADSRWKQKSE